MVSLFHVIVVVHFIFKYCGSIWFPCVFPEDVVPNVCVVPGVVPGVDPVCKGLHMEGFQ